MQSGLIIEVELLARVSTTSYVSLIVFLRTTPFAPWRDVLAMTNLTPKSNYRVDSLISIIDDTIYSLINLTMVSLCISFPELSLLAINTNRDAKLSTIGNL